MQSQLQRQEIHIGELEVFVEECNSEIKLVQDKYESKCQENSFLEEECRMLREILSDRKGDAQSRARVSPTSSENMSDNFIDIDEETDSVLDQFSDLREEINNTGSVLVGESSAESGIFERLTNPSYFTGIQKKYF